MSKVIGTITVAFEGRTVEADMILTGGGLTTDWKARSESDHEWMENLVGLERTISRALDADDRVGEYKGITVTLSEV